MNTPAKRKFLTWALVVLLLANIATILVFWIERSNRPQPGKERPDQFVIRELALDKQQEEKYRELVSAHRNRAEQLRREVRDAKDHFFGLLQQPGVTDSIKSAAAGEVSKVTEQLDMLTLEHFQQVRALCNESQRQKFDAIIKDVLRTMGGPGPGPGQGRENGPPPPHPRE